MLNPQNALDDPAKASQRDYAHQFNRVGAPYQYQRSTSSKPIESKPVPEKVKGALSHLKVK